MFFVPDIPVLEWLTGERVHLFYMDVISSLTMKK